MLLTLNQTDVPESDKVKVQSGWTQRYFGPIKQLFGYGASLF